MLAGVRKMPLPIVDPISTATALHSPSFRGSRSPHASAALAASFAGPPIVASDTSFPARPQADAL